jgi:hypothetical protein
MIHTFCSMYYLLFTLKLDIKEKIHHLYVVSFHIIKTNYFFARFFCYLFTDSSPKIFLSLSQLFLLSHQVVLQDSILETLWLVHDRAFEKSNSHN